MFSGKLLTMKLYTHEGGPSTITYTQTHSEHSQEQPSSGIRGAGGRWCLKVSFKEAFFSFSLMLINI